MYADIIVDITHEKLDKVFQYRIPSHLEGMLKVGTEVVVPFGKGNKEINGYVTGFSERAEYAPEKMDVVREFLNYDYYLRENAKSRPEFAGDYLVDKNVARAFYEKEEETHMYLPDYGKYDRNQMRKMTHLEYFKLTDTYILFDYQNRNPLNQEARVCKIEKIKL